MARKYTVLVVRDNATSPFGVAFGDYSRNVVTQESADSYSDYSKADKRILTLDSDTQAAIDHAVAQLNTWSE